MGHESPVGERAELIVVAGGTTPAGREGVDRVLAHLLGARGTVVMHHDLRDLDRGLVRRRLRTARADTTEVVELPRGNVSWALRAEVLPSLRHLAHRPETRRIVLHLDPVLEPEQVCFAVAHVVVAGIAVAEAVTLRGVVSVLDTDTWLDDALDNAALAHRGLAAMPDDERTIAQLVVAQAEFADLLVLVGETAPWVRSRTVAVLDRLNPLADRLTADGVDDRVLLHGLPAQSRRGCPDSAHAPLLRGQPPLHPAAGVQLLTVAARRPFHPGRLHTAVDVLLDGVVRARGRLWLATRPEAALWLRSAGGGLELGYAGDWLPDGASPNAAEEWEQAGPERTALAAASWHPRWGERTQELAVLLVDADPDRIRVALRAALLTEAELDAGQEEWRRYPDPFGWWHSDPCDSTGAGVAPTRTRKDEA